MGRPRRPYNGVEGIEPLRERFMKRYLPHDTLGVRKGRRWEASRHWQYKVANGLYDPLTYMFVLDAVANINPDIELRANNLVRWLDENNDAFVWDAITVGKVLADICDEFEEFLGKKNGLLERGKDYKGTFYRIHHNPETALGYFHLRDALYSQSEEEIERRKRGERTQRIVSPLLEIDFKTGNWIDPDGYFVRAPKELMPGERAEAI